MGGRKDRSKTSRSPKNRNQNSVMSHIVKHLEIDVSVNFEHSVGSLSDGAGEQESQFSRFWNCRKSPKSRGTGRAGKIGLRPERGSGEPEALTDSLGTSGPGTPRNRGSSRGFHKRITKKEGFKIFGRIRRLNFSFFQVQKRDF